jgi:hypothetical protein
MLSFWMTKEMPIDGINFSPRDCWLRNISGSREGYFAIAN